MITSKLATEFNALISRKGVSEGKVQEFMEKHSELIPTPFLLGHGFHWNSVISKFEIGRRKTDFAYITKNSGQWRFVFVELEPPQKKLFITKPHIEFHSDTRYAISQIEGWKHFAERNQEEIVRRLAPLMRPERMRDNPIDIRYILVIGRNPEGEFPTPEYASRIKRLKDESKIQLLTYDSLLRMGEHYGVGKKKNILTHHLDSFAIKSAQTDTIMFSYFNPQELLVRDHEARWFIERGYNIAAWRNGEMLRLNHKQPWSRCHEMFQQTQASDGIPNPPADDE